MTTAAMPATIWAVEISISSAKPFVCGANPDVIHISKDAGQEAEWYSAAPCIIKFVKGSPFTEKEFHVPAHGSVSSGKVVRDDAIPCTGCEHLRVGKHTHYKYSITDLSGKVLADPQVIVKK